MKHWFRNPSALEVLRRQREGSHRAYLEHLAAAETHSALADSYKIRLARIDSMLTLEDPTIPRTRLLDPLDAVHGRP